MKKNFNKSMIVLAEKHTKYKNQFKMQSDGSSYFVKLKKRVKILLLKDKKDINSKRKLLNSPKAHLID